MCIAMSIALTFVYTYACVYLYIYTYVSLYNYGVATISRLLKIIGLFWQNTVSFT